MAGLFLSVNETIGIDSAFGAFSSSQHFRRLNFPKHPPLEERSNADLPTIGKAKECRGVAAPCSYQPESKERPTPIRWEGFDELPCQWSPAGGVVDPASYGRTE